MKLQRLEVSGVVSGWSSEKDQESAFRSLSSPRSVDNSIPESNARDQSRYSGTPEELEFLIHLHNLRNSPRATPQVSLGQLYSSRRATRLSLDELAKLRLKLEEENLSDKIISRRVNE